VINEGLPEEWPARVRAAVAPFRQGHLVETPPFFYAANLEHPVWELSEIARDSDAENDEPEDALLELDPDQRPPYGSITTQTCDLAEERPEPVQPWLQVAPVYQCEPGSTLLERDFVVPLSPPTLPGEGWVADLRLEMSLEKGYLVGREPLEAFSSESEYDRFGDLLARRRGRPALASVFHEVINVTTRSMKQESSAKRSMARRVRDNVYKLKLGIEDGTRLRPVAAKLYVVTQGEAEAETEEWFAEWWSRAKAVAADHGLQLLPTGWMNSGQLDAEIYDDLVEIRNPLFF
jgi:hypothetical protein